MRNCGIIRPTQIMKKAKVPTNNYYPFIRLTSRKCDIVARMRQVVDEFSDKVIIGEVYLPIQRLMAYYGHDNRGAHLPFNFQLIQLPWNAQDIATAIDQYEG